MHADKDVAENIAIFDGDNTLWDTNAVFTNAQKDILRGLAKAGIPADPERDFGLLREVDGLLIKYFSKHEYDSTYLPLCLIRRLQGESVDDCEQVARIVAAENTVDLQLAQKLGAAFWRASALIPPLLPDVLESLSLINQTGRTLMTLYSEGRQERTSRICDHYGMSKYFHHIHLGNKSLEDWFKFKNQVLALFNERYPNDKRQPKMYVIGDHLERDIRPGNLIGAKTIYKPGGYKGREHPKDNEHQPAVIVESLREVVQLL
jgi:phosphoglycolate phosphatase-like HAD superfamily hydrolase